MSIPVTQSPPCNTTFPGYGPCQSHTYGHTFWSPGAYSKAEFKAQKKYFKIQARVSKCEAHALTREAKSQVNGLKREIKHQTKELKLQAKEFKRETRHQTQETLKTIKKNLQGDHYYKYPVSPVNVLVSCTDHRYGRCGDRRQRKQERQLECHARRDCRRSHQSMPMPLQFVLRTVIKRGIRLLTGQESRSDDHLGQHATVIRPEPLVAIPTAPTRPMPKIYTTSPLTAPTLVYSSGMGAAEIPPIPQEPLLVYAMSNMTLKLQPADDLSSQVPSSPLSRLETPTMTASPHPDLEFVVREDHDNVDLDTPPPPYQASVAHQL